MSAVDIVTVARFVLEEAISEANVVIGIHRTIPDGEIVMYLYHDGSEDVEKSGPIIVQRTHTVPIHLLLRVGTGDTDDAVEIEIMDLHDRICNAFYSHRTLSGACSSAILGQRDQPRGAGSGAYVFEGTSEYRHRWWTLVASETLSFPVTE
jgi:hypothetical protein